MARRGRVDDDEVMAPAAPARAPARQLPDLHHAHELLRARRRGGEVLEGAARGEHPPGDAPAEGLQPLEQRAIGVDRDARQAVARSSTSAPADALAAEHGGQRGSARRPPTTIVRRPARGRGRPIAAAIVVLPTPPLPVMKSSSRSSSDCIRRGSRASNPRRDPAVPTIGCDERAPAATSTIRSPSTATASCRAWSRTGAPARS